MPIPDKGPHLRGTNTMGKRDSTIGMDQEKRDYFQGGTETEGLN
jgi:hypothetical protein